MHKAQISGAYLFELAAITFLLLLSAAVVAEDKAVILAYHHIATDTPTSTSIAPDVFAQHLDYLDSNGFNVWPLVQILDALADNEPLPPRTVALTFDDAYESVYTTAWPALKLRNYPFTVFVATDPIDQHLSPYMSWSQLRELAEAGVAMGNHGAAHIHPHNVTYAEFRDDIEQAQERLKSETGVTPRVYAYPYGEFDDELSQIVRTQDLFGVGQQSGVAGSRVNLGTVPRFPISPNYSSPDAFSLRVNAYPLDVTILEPESRLVGAGDPNPQLVMESLDPDYPPSALNCFSNTGQALEKTVISDTRLAIVSTGNLKRGRSKYTCTARVPGSNAYAWYSHLWIAR